MSRRARLLERARHIRHAMKVRAAARRDTMRRPMRHTTDPCVPGPERLEDRLLLSGTIIDNPVDRGFVFDYVGRDSDAAATVSAAIATNGAAIGLNFAGRTSSSNPPDTMGAVGSNHIVELINGAYGVYDKLDGSQITTSSLNAFWTNAGVTHNRSFDPRVLYDSTRNRFYATAVNSARNDNEILFAISDTSDPTDGWTGFTVDSDSQNGQRWADFPQMSFDDDGVYIGVNMFDQDTATAPVYSTTRTTWVLPLADLTDGNPSIENATLIEDHQAITGASAQGVVYDSGGAGLPAIFLRGGGSTIRRAQLDGPINTPSFTDLPDISVTSRDSPPLAEQPNDDDLTGLQTGGTRIRSKVEYMNNAYWGVHGVEATNGNAGLRFFEISTAGTLNQEVFISHPTLDLFYGSIAVNGDEDVVIGCSASGPDAGQFPSSYAVIGDTTVGGTTTFGTVFELFEGTATYQNLDSSGRNRWGDYSATVLDPSDSNVFWTFQEYTTGASSWGTSITQILLDGTPGVGGYVELNPFGDATLANTLTDSADTDVFAFALDLSGNTQIDVDDNSGLLDAGLRLWDYEDDMIVDVDLDTNDGDPQISESLSAWNLYAAEIFSESNSGNFTLSIDGPTPSVSTISLDADGNATKTSTIGSGGNDADYYRVVAPATNTGDLTLTLTPAAGSELNGVLTLYDSTGVQLLRANSGGSEAVETINYTGAVAGETYYARVGAYNYASAGGYTLDIDFDFFLPATWSADAEAFATIFRDGTSRDVLSQDANLQFAGDIDSYYFASDTSGNVVIDVDDFGNRVDPVVAVYDATSGALLGFDDNGGPDDNAQLTVAIGARTRYIVAVADADATATGDLGITIDTETSQSGANILIGIDGIGTSTYPYIQSVDSDFLRFTTPANTAGSGTVTVTPAGTLDVEFVMFDAAGNELDRGNPSSTGNPSSFSYNGFAPNTEYYLTVHSDDYDTTGDVTLVEVDLDLYGAIHGTKFYDRDQDGIRDRGEEPLRGWTIYVDENNNGEPDPGEPTTVTDENGEYAFTNLPAGTHVVREILKAGWTQTAPGDGSTLLYNVRFDTPPHTVGAAPAVGAGPATRETISSIQFGMPTVVAASDALDQPLLFATSTTSYEQIAFDLDDFGQTFDHYAINMDLLVQTLEPGSDVFSVFIDAPAFRKVVFYGDGTIEEHVAGSPATQIGNYVKGDVLDLRIDVDLVAAIWTITLDGAVLHHGGFQTTDIEGMRLNLNDSGVQTAGVAADNITVRGRNLGPTVPHALADADGNGNNRFPFYTPIYGEMRYQQIYDASQFASSGTIDQIRFRPDVTKGSAFNPIDFDLQINLGYAATTVDTASVDFADNIGSGYTTVHDGIMTLSSNNVGSLPAFDVILDVDDLFHYDPAQGDLLVDIVNRSASNLGFSTLDATRTPENAVTNRIYGYDLNAASGQITDNPPYGLVTHFVFTDDGHHTITLGAGEVATADFGNISSDSTPPHVTEVLVRGTWSRGYFNALNNLGLGLGGYSIPVGSDAQLDPLPFAALDELVVRFSEPVNIGLDDVRLVGVLGPDGVDDADDDYDILSVTTVIGGTGAFEAVIELDAPIATDKLLLTLFDSTDDASLNHLDGEWTDGASTYPSGDGDEGGDFGFRFNVLPGDLNQNGTVDGGDLSKLLGAWLKGVPPAHPFIDITGNTGVGGGDLAVLLGNWLASLPDGTPTNSAGGGVIAALPAILGADGGPRRFGLGSFGSWQPGRTDTSTPWQDDDDNNVDLLATTGGRTVTVDAARSLDI